MFTAVWTAFVRSSTTSSMVDVGLSWARTLALSTRRKAWKSSFLPSSFLGDKRGGCGGASCVGGVWRVAVYVIWLWSEERRLCVFQLPKDVRPLEAMVTSMAVDGTHLMDPGKEDRVYEPSLSIWHVLASERTASAITFPEGFARRACPQDGCLALKSPPMQ